MSHNQPEPGTASEPLLSTGTIVTTATAILALIVSFGVPVTDAQQAAILGVLAVTAPLLVAIVGRGRVYAPDTVRALLARERTRR